MVTTTPPPTRGPLFETRLAVVGVIGLLPSWATSAPAAPPAALAAEIPTASAPAAPPGFCNGLWGAYPSDGACNYTEVEWSAFVATVEKRPGVRLATLGRSTAGRPIPVLHLGRLDGKHRALVYFQARQHCREWKTSYALEGAVKWALGDDQRAAWLRRNVLFVVVPWVNIDKCLTGSIDRGDDGHGDLNRVWLLDPPALMSPAVIAIKTFLRQQTREDLPAVGLDWHCPNRDGGGGSGFEHMLMSWNSPDANKRRADAVVAHVSKHATSRNTYVHIGKDNDTKPGMFSAWAPTLPGMKAAMTPEIRENSLGIEDARAVGRDTIVGISSWLQETIATRRAGEVPARPRAGRAGLE
jgi:hypothetical protein